MYLKQLDIRGFKSFASATTLRFEPGITAVVGPNGSGKSNIVDALTWVMGEQGAKNLRGASMEDVIFAGTSSRPPLGRAQVSLTIDNTDHTLDIDYSEVTISRTIFRNGGSEYAINGTPCRLLDIQELLSDTGLGQQMHVIVGQGRLDAILKADPSGHRAFIEEAAGILKHRKRKERALRKLANTETNLARLDDLLGEIRRRMGPLGRQSRIARRADAIQVSVRDARSRLYADDAQQAMERRAAVRSELGQVRAELTAAQRELAQVKVRIEQVEALSSASNPAIAQANQYWHEFSQTRERLNAVAQLAEERGRSLAGQIVTNTGEDPSILLKRAEELEAQAETQSTVVADARLALDKAIETRANDERKLASVRQTLTQLRTTVQKRDSRIASLRELIAREEAAVQSAATRADDYRAQQQSVNSQCEDAQQQLDALRRETDNVSDDDGKALEAARAQLAVRRDALNELTDRQRTLQSTIISLNAKADALRDTLESRNASGALEQDKDVAALGRLTSFIHVEDGWEEAIAHALGQFAGAVVVPATGNMMHALERARTDKLGKAVMLTAAAGETSAAPAYRGGAAAEAVAAMPSGARLAAELIDINPAASNQSQAEAVVAAVRMLLSDVAVTATAEDAQQLVADGTVARAVTKAGEIFTRGVAAAGGSSLAQSDLSLAARRDKALAQVKQLEHQLETLTAELEQAKEARDEAARAVDRESAKRTEARIRAEQARQSLKAAADRVATLANQRKRLEASVAEIEAGSEEHQLKLDDLNRALESARQADDGSANFDELDERERTLERELTVAREHEIAAKIAWTEAGRTADSLQRQAGLLRDNAKQAAERCARIEQLNTRRREQIARLQSVADDAREVAAMVEQSLKRVTERREALQQAVSNHDEELKTLRAQRNTLEPKVTDLTGREHALDVNRERLAAEYGQLTQQVSDALGMSLEELIAEYGPDQPVPVLDDNGNPIPLEEGDSSTPLRSARNDEGMEATSVISEGEAAASDTANGGGIAASVILSGGEAGVEGSPIAYQTVPYNRAEQQKRLDKATRDLAALGKINPLATEEYDALQERNAYLNDQRADVAKSRDDLMQLINDLDATMVEVFRSAFDDTAKAFETMFATLFPGGTGRLRLDNPQDMLTTGVLVEASPAGKRVKQLSLLSGGERSLTALALLFAIFTARPSPFYVMDEVEAALDDTNLTRLINAFNELREHAQLIIITHQQRTMSIADALYGVTMRSDGVTSVISQRLDRDAHNPVAA
ncbi:AAA family ATPase [Bifidobacterium oedipodis]|uniref:Chromosome partition protein Smc n=1 Tax=Bifidobacterium oedipodis TaxID=2675322 RepID=A0A7Y0EMP0_9BIFI|nr:AAA family ATPase [Bifidobacterium sp. DSM 109957]NMM92977.1 chromosome segregation protein SMC [Bifidobacterium sp. DSM 109957]